MALASFPSGLSEIEIKRRLCERRYGNEAKIDSLRRKAWLRSFIGIFVPHQIPEAARGDYAEGGTGTEIEKITVAGDQYIGPCSQSRSENPLVIRVSHRNGGRRGRLRCHFVLAEEALNRADCPQWKLQFLSQDASQLS